MAKRKENKNRRGEGGVYKDGDGWRAIIVDSEGNEIKRRATTYEAAEALRQEMIEQRDKGIDVSSGNQALSVWLATWQELKARKLSPRSLDNNQRMIDGYLVPLLGDYALNRTTSDRLQRTLHRIQDDIVRESEGRYAGTRTVHALAQILSAVFDLALKRRLISHNPMEGVELPTYRAAEPTPLEDADLRAVITTPHALAPLWGLCALLGLRRGEALGLRWQDIAFDSALVTITQQVQDIGGALVIGQPKYDSRRVLPLPSSLIESLRRRRREQLELRLKRGDTWRDYDLVFCSKDGRPLWPKNVEDDWRALRKQLGFTANLHALRHTLATLLDECGASDALKASILGHGKKNITLKYTHGRIAAMHRVIESVERRVLGEAGEQAKEG